MKIVINGIGVAGPALGYWLTKAGHQVLLVEEAPRLRAGGYIIDFWGIGYDIAEKIEVNTLSGDAALQNRESAAAVATFKAAGVDHVFIFIPFTTTSGYYQEVARSNAGFKNASVKSSR